MSARRSYWFRLPAGFPHSRRPLEWDPGNVGKLFFSSRHPTWQPAHYYAGCYWWDKQKNTPPQSVLVGTFNWVQSARFDSKVVNAKRKSYHERGIVSVLLTIAMKFLTLKTKIWARLRKSSAGSHPHSHSMAKWTMGPEWMQHSQIFYFCASNDGSIVDSPSSPFWPPWDTGRCSTPGDSGSFTAGGELSLPVSCLSWEQEQKIFVPFLTSLFLSWTVCANLQKFCVVCLCSSLFVFGL